MILLVCHYALNTPRRLILLSLSVEQGGNNYNLSDCIDEKRIDKEEPLR